MSRKRTFDYDAARARHEAGETQAAIAASLGVSQFAVSRAVNEERRRKADAAVRKWAREKRLPCLGGCGRLVWAHRPGRTGYCTKCLAAKGRAERGPNHGSESEYSYGCRCDLCRSAAAAAKQERRVRSRRPCSHGCGTLVDTIDRRDPGKPLECRKCAQRRVAAARRAA